MGSKEQFFKKLMKDMPKWNEHIKGRVKEVKEHFDCLFADAEKITNQKIQALCYFSLVECFAQEFCNNSKRPTDAFCDFILKFAQDPKYSILTEIDPVTAFYRHQENATKAGYSLDYLEDTYQYIAEQICELEESKDLVRFLTQFRKTNDDHTYLKLLYKLRCKLSHNFKAPVQVPKTFIKENEIFYQHFHISTFSKPNSKQYEWHLIFSNSYIKTLFMFAIDNYLQYCLDNKQDPFKNSRNYLSWYE